MFMGGIHVGKSGFWLTSHDVLLIWENPDFGSQVSNSVLFLWETPDFVSQVSNNVLFIREYLDFW